MGSEILFCKRVRGSPENSENQVAEIGFPTTYFEDSFISHSVTNCSCNWRSFPITPVVLKFHCQRHFDDCLKISVLGRLDGNYESVSNGALKLCTFFQKDLNYVSNRILPRLCISLISDSLVEKFQTLATLLN